MPRFRWSSPAIPKRRGLVRGTRRVRQGPSPASRAGVKRLGPGRGAAVDYMERVERRVPLAEMAEALGVERPRDLVRRKATEKGRDGRLVMLLDAGILVFDGEAFDLPPDWRSGLEEARELGKEIEREDLERERHRRQREAFRNRHKTEPTHHYANDPNADGHIEELRLEDEPEEGGLEETPVSSLAAVVRDYLDRNPHDACQPPGWIGSTLWAFALYPGKPTAAQISAALEELGGDRYRRELLQRGRSRRGAA